MNKNKISSRAKLLLLTMLFPVVLFAQVKMAVTIDDLPLQNSKGLSPQQYSALFTKLMENVIAQKAPAIGFVNEDKLIPYTSYDESRIALLINWIRSGLDLGNHTFSHPSLNKVSVEEFKKDIMLGERILRNLMEKEKKELKYFRHPYLQTGLSLTVKKEIDDFLSSKKYTIAPVTIDNGEWIFASAYLKAIDSNKTNMMKNIGRDYIDYMKRKIEYWESQSIALFGRNINHVLLIHANALNAEYYDELCQMIREKKYEFTTLDEALKDEAYKSEDTFIRNAGISWIHRWALTKKVDKSFFGNEPTVPEHILKYAKIESE